MAMRRGLYDLLTIAAIPLALASCGGTAEAAEQGSRSAAEPKVSAVIAPEGRTCAPGDIRVVGSKRRAYAAIVKQSAWGSTAWWSQSTIAAGIVSGRASWLQSMIFCFYGVWK